MVSNKKSSLNELIQQFEAFGKQFLRSDVFISMQLLIVVIK